MTIENYASIGGPQPTGAKPPPVTRDEPLPHDDAHEKYPRDETPHHFTATDEELLIWDKDGRLVGTVPFERIPAGFQEVARSVIVDEAIVREVMRVRDEHPLRPVRETRELVERLESLDILDEEMRARYSLRSKLIHLLIRAEHEAAASARNIPEAFEVVRAIQTIVRAVDPQPLANLAERMGLTTLLKKKADPGGPALNQAE